MIDAVSSGHSPSKHISCTFCALKQDLRLIDVDCWTVGGNFDVGVWSSFWSRLEGLQDGRAARRFHFYPKKEEKIHTYVPLRVWLAGNSDEADRWESFDTMHVLPVLQM